MLIGTTFSHTHLEQLKIDPSIALKELKSLGIKLVRLGVYWNEVEKTPGKYSYYNVEKLVNYCEKENIKVLLTVGMKAPRYPEFYIPDWVLNKSASKRLAKLNKNDRFLYGHCMKLIEKTITHFKDSPAIIAWQIENEPLDPSGPKWWKIGKDFLEKEVALARRIDPKRKIVVNLWGNELTKRKLYKTDVEFADIVGLDLYLRRPAPILKWFHKYIGPLDSFNKIKIISNDIHKQGKQVWITELQAEPWEPDEILTKKKNPPSFLPKHFKSNISYASKLGPEAIILWGFEYWYWKKINGDDRYWKSAKDILRRFNR
jgi:endo-1,4-beta-mannosidase